MEEITLFSLNRADISISMRLYFNEDNQLIFDGYDCGKTVSDVWGDSDYEYTYTLEPIQVNKFYEIFGLQSGDRLSLLLELKKRFGVNEAYTLMGKFMEDNNIQYKSFTWS